METFPLLEELLNTAGLTREEYTHSHHQQSHELVDCNNKTLLRLMLIMFSVCIVNGNQQDLNS